MRLFSSNGASNGSARPAGPEPAHTRDKRLFKWAVLFAGVTSVLMVTPIPYGFGVSAGFAVPAFLVAWVLFWLVNYWTVRRMSRQPPPRTLPKVRVALAFCGALVVLQATVFWVFAEDIEAARTPAVTTVWTAEIENLQSERGLNQTTVDRPIPAADSDPQVTRLQQQVDELTKTVRQVKLDELCELDGTCGTGKEGVGLAYREKLAYRIQLEGQLQGLGRQLADARTASEEQVTKLVNQRDAARGRVAGIDARLADLKAKQPDRRGKFAAFLTVADAKPGWVILVSMVVGLVFLFVDWWALRWALRGVYDTGDEQLPLVVRSPDGTTLEFQAPPDKKIQTPQELDAKKAKERDEGKVEECEEGRAKERDAEKDGE